MAFITIQSSSPFRAVALTRGFCLCDPVALAGLAWVWVQRVLGLGGSSSAMMRRISSYPAEKQRLLVEGWRPGEEFVKEHTKAVDVRAGVVGYVGKRKRFTRVSVRERRPR